MTFACAFIIEKIGEVLSDGGKAKIGGSSDHRAHTLMRFQDGTGSSAIT